MTFLSVCSGIEAASVAWQPLGFQAVAFAEIERFPSAVLQHHFPNTTNLGDITYYEEWNLPQFDILVGGTPCQSFSTAGKKLSLADERGQLSLTFCRIAKRFQPKWVVWENVPAVLSRKDKPFQQFITELEHAGYRAEWRILNAADFGVPQKRKRLFVVAQRLDIAESGRSIFLDGETSDVRIAQRENGNSGTAGKGTSRMLWYNWHGKALRVTPCIDCAYTVVAHYGVGGNDKPLIVDTERNTVRWIHPIECERLQGFPDNWTQIPWRGKPAEKCPKTLRYKAIGNSMPVPVMRWIGEKIKQLTLNN